jgi:hypothetical protein
MVRCSWALSLLFVLACSGVSADSDDSDNSACDLARELRAHAGRGATDCGVSEPLEDPSSLDECAVTAFENGMPFVARYVLQGTDSEVELGVASDDAGSVVFLLWDSDPSGGSGAGATIYGDVCHGPSVDSSPDTDPVTPPFTCAGMSSLGKVCG